MRKSTIVSSTIALTLILSACSGGDATSETTADPGEAVAEQDLGPPPPPEGGQPVASDSGSPSASADQPEVIEGIVNKRLSFAPGTSSSRVSGVITGSETIDYLLNVRAGQSMNVSMATQNTATYFNILEPGETEVAIYNGSINGNMYEGVANKSGDYRIRIYMMRSAARRNEKADFGLEVAVD